MSQPIPTPVKATYVGTWIVTLLLIVTFVFGLLLFPPYFEPVEGMAEPVNNVLFFGRFHPILVHLPVGILVFLMVIETLCLRRSVEVKFGEAALLALVMGSAGAVFAVLAGIMLSREGGYEGGTFTLHQGLGIIGTAGILLGLLMRLAGMSTENRGLVDGYRAVLLVSFSLMGIGAHFGANMVHGSKYMTQYAPPMVAEQITGMEKWMLSLVEGPEGEVKVAAAKPEVEKPKVEEAVKVEPAVVAPAAPVMVLEAPVVPVTPVVPAVVKTEGPMVAGAEGKMVFEHLVLPIFEEKCNKCHNADKSKGDLRMDTHEMVMKGGETAGNVVLGKPDESLMITRINLPEDDDEHMPPEGKPQISPEELALLRWWIEQGATNTMTVKDANLPPEIKSLVEKLLSTVVTDQGREKNVVRTMATGSWLRRVALVAATMTVAAVGQGAEEVKGPSPAMLEAVKKVEEEGASLLPIAAGVSSYRFTALNVAKTFSDAGLEALMPVVENIVSLDLARTQVTDAGLAKVAKMNALKELRLDNTGIGDAGLAHLIGLSNLEYLNVYGSKVTDAGIQKLAGLANLKALYVWQTGVTKAGVAQLKGKLPKTEINNGWSAEDDAKVVVAAPVVAEAAGVSVAAKPAVPEATVAASKVSGEAAAKAVVYRDVVAPILAEKCYSCHGEEKGKGKLRMHTFADLKKGGSEGEVNLVAGKSGDSLMVQRILLANDDDEHMPPEDEPQVTKEELALLKWWIDNGASESETVAVAKKSTEIEGLLAVALTKVPVKPVDLVQKVEKPKAKPLTEEQKKKVKEITTQMLALNATLMPLAQDTEQLRLSVINAADKFGDKELALLEPIADQILWLDLARSQVTDAGMEMVAKMVHLGRLHLENTKVTDAGLAKLAKLGELEYMNLYGTKVTDGGLAKLEGAKALKKLFVWQTGVTKAGATVLEGKVAGLVVNVGLSEAEIAKLTAPPPAPPPAAKAEERKPEAKADAPPVKKKGAGKVKGVDAVKEAPDSAKPVAPAPAAKAEAKGN